MNIKKMIFVGIMAATMASAAGKPENAAPRTDTFVIIDCQHYPDFSGYMKCITLSDYIAHTDRPEVYLINEDPEDLFAGDVLSVTISAGIVTDYYCSGYVF